MTTPTQVSPPVSPPLGGEAGRSDRPERPAEFQVRDGRVFRACGPESRGYYTPPDLCRKLLGVYRRAVLNDDWWASEAADLHEQLTLAMREAGIPQEQ